MPCKNPYKSIKAKLEKVIDETPNIKTFVLRPKEKLSFEAGQFMMVGVPGMGDCPFTPSSDPKKTDTLDFTIMKTGQVTSKLHEMEAGETLLVRGPYGQPYPIREFYGKEVYIVGGGCGLAPLRSLLFALFHEIDNLKKIEARLGCKTPADISYKQAIEKDWKKRAKTNIVATVDEKDGGWKGNVGVVTTILKDKDVQVDNAVAIVCGPPIMMKFATKRLLDMGFADKNIYLSMERNMSCGIGKCFHCNIGKYFVCKDGPVFTWEQIKDIPDPW
ncbi:FAD/NAD(P)-binding protein [Candidatus Margulisiibacteriota bacterium]